MSRWLLQGIGILEGVVQNRASLPFCRLAVPGTTLGMHRTISTLSLGIEGTSPSVSLIVSLGQRAHLVGGEECGYLQ